MDHSEVKHFPKVDHTPNDLDEASKLLLRAAALIDERGLCKWDATNGAQFCIQGAINYCGSNGESAYFNDIQACAEAKRRVGAAVPGGHESLWNNAPERTKEEVVAKLRAVALGL